MIVVFLELCTLKDKNKLDKTFNTEEQTKQSDFVFVKVQFTKPFDAVDSSFVI